MQAIRLAFCLTILVGLLTSCAARKPGEFHPESQDEIVVAAAANLTEAFDEIGRRFTSKTGVRVVNSFGATADLAKQIENGAPFDVFAAADVKHGEELERKGLLVNGSRAAYARGRLILWVPRANSEISTVEQLSDSGVTRVALAKPELAPYGAAAVESLRGLNLWEKVEPKIVYAQNVAQAKQFAATGNVDAAFLPRSLVKVDEGRMIAIDSALHSPIDQELGIIGSSKKQETARRFRDFVLSEEGQSLLESFGYERVN